MSWSVGVTKKSQMLEIAALEMSLGRSSCCLRSIVSKLLISFLVIMPAAYSGVKWYMIRLLKKALKINFWR